MKIMSLEERERRAAFLRMIAMQNKRARLELICMGLNPELVRPDLGKMTFEEKELFLKREIMKKRWITNKGQSDLNTFNNKLQGLSKEG